MSTFQCPNGYFISKFASAYDGTERFYKFSCTKFGKDVILHDEECTTTEAATTENGDMYMSCGSSQYTVGVEIIENVQTSVDSWQLLCCKSNQIEIRSGDCIETKFINDNRKSSFFSTGTQVVRRWQSMSENGDRRWWMQLCPIDINIKKPQGVLGEVRARRQVPWEWSRGRYPVTDSDYNPQFLDQEKLQGSQRRRLFTNSRESPENILVFSREGMATTIPEQEEEITPGPIRLKNINGRYTANPGTDRLENYAKSLQHKYYTTPQPSSTTTLSTTTEQPPTTTQTSPSTTKLYRTVRPATTVAPLSEGDKPEKPTSGIDYYDVYDENFDKKKHAKKNNNLLDAVQDMFENIKDGLSLVQFPIKQPANTQHQQQNNEGYIEPPEVGYNGNQNNGGFNQPRLPTHPIYVNLPPKIMPLGEPIAFSSDDGSFNINSDGPNSKISFKMGPFTNQPSESDPKIIRPLVPKDGQGTIDTILQTLGLCQGH
uniref:C-CAP/cofactor C-like domain-containing protein n=1 Tax=Rhabditophanes sp. KR3021 TaxID=114890 RepID=A0AC35TQ71_9BILA